MIRMDRVESTAILAAVVSSYEQIVTSVGSTRFYRALSRTLHDGVPIDRLYVIEGSARDAPLIAESEDDKPQVSGATYAKQFLPHDPLQQAIDLALANDAVVRLVITPAAIVVPAYRAMLERAGVIERVSFVQRHDAAWRCLTVVRRTPHEAFQEDELEWLGGFYRLIMPLIDRHRALTGEIVEDRADRLAELEERFARRFPALPPRECQVCARAAIGVSIEGAALDLGIGTASVLTYRKRAYGRLGVTSAYELARLVMR